MPTTTPDYAVNLERSHFVVPMRQSAVVLEEAGAAHANNGAGLSAWLNTAQAMDGLKVVEPSGKGNTFEILIGSKKLAVTKAALATGTATLTFAAAHGITSGSTIRVRNLPAPFASLNGTVTVTAVTTSTPFTVSYALAGTNIAEATVAAGEVVSDAYPYPLDGTGKPIRLASVTGAPLSNNTNTENIITEDAVTRGDSIPLALSNSRSVALAGRAVLKDLSFKIMGIFDDYTVSEKLAVKYLRIGPQGDTEKTFFYGLVTSKSDAGNAGEGYTYSATITPMGQKYTLFDNAI